MLRSLGLLPIAGLLLFAWIELILKLLNLKGTGDELGPVIFVILCDLIGALLVIIFRNVHAKQRGRVIEKHAAAWLRNRRSNLGNRCSWRSRVLLLVPSALAVLFFLFEPETIGIWEHINGQGDIRVGEYSISTPVTWIRYTLPDRESPNEQWVMMALGAARMAHHPYWDRIGPQVIWQIGFSTRNVFDPHPFQARRFPEVLSKRTTLIADREGLPCEEWQYGGTYVHLARIACSIPENNLYIHAEGDLTKMNVFYEFLQRHTSRPPRAVAQAIR
jgi:hypothetical protein